VNSLDEGSVLFVRPTSTSKDEITWDCSITPDTQYSESIHHILQPVVVQIYVENTIVFSTQGQSGNKIQVSLVDLMASYFESSKIIHSLRVVVSYNGLVEESADFVIVHYAKMAPGPWIQDGKTGEDVDSTILRKDFSISSSLQVAKAVVFFAGLGLAELEVNDKLVSVEVLQPQWSKYDKRIIGNGFQIDPSVFLTGQNKIVVYLGNGMYNVPSNSGRYQKFAGSFGPRRLSFSLVLQFSDSNEVTILSDQSWNAFPQPTPIIFNTIYGGESFDAGIPTPPIGSWPNAVIWNGPTVPIVPESAPLVKVLETISPIAITQPQTGTFLYDFGRNFAGRPLITLSISPDNTNRTQVHLTPGELLDPKTGLVTQASSGSPMYFSYIINTENSTVKWYPRFSYYGFRWIQVTGATPSSYSGVDATLPVIISLQGQRIGSSVPVAGSFSSNNPLFNKIHQMILFAMQSNLQSIATDCPHREKLGWLEEDHLMGPSILYNFDMKSFYPKIVQDMIDSQLSNGLIPDIAPEYVVFSGGFRDSPEWGSTMLLVSVLQYVHYQDTSLLSLIFDQKIGAPAIRYINYLLGLRGTDGTLNYGLGDWNDIGQTISGQQYTPIGITATLTLFMDLIASSSALTVLKDPNAPKYLQLAQQVGEAFQKRFLVQNSNSAHFGSNSQTSNAMPLSINTLITNTTLKSFILESLITNIVTPPFQNRTSCGEVGFPAEICSLSLNNRNDIIEAILLNGTGWGYRYIVETMQATTLTEAWNGARGESQNHFMLGHIDAWFYGVVAGINFGRWNLKYFQQQIADLSFCNWWQFGLANPDDDIVLYLKPKIFDIKSVSEVQAWHYKQHIGNVSIQWTREDNNLQGVGFTIVVSIDPVIHKRAIICIPVMSSYPTTRKDSEFATWLGSQKDCDLFLLSAGSHTFTRLTYLQQKSNT